MTEPDTTVPNWHKPRRGTFTAESLAKAAATRARNKAAKAAKMEAKMTEPPSPRETWINPRSSEFEGLTAKDCAKGCGPDGCVISGRDYCAHPMKGALQAIDLQNRAAIERIERARKHIGR